MTSSLNRRALLSLTVSAAALMMTRPGYLWGRSVRSGDLTQLTLQEAAIFIRNREISPVELTNACLARIREHESRINAFITETPQLALAQAQTAEREIQQGHWRGPLHGIPIALKDSIDTAGVRTTAASAVFIDRVPTEDAEVVRRLKQAGAVLLGKLNMQEFAIGPGVGSYWGPVHNPWALNFEPGGSSSGSGAAIAADFCFGTLGTDTSGSVRWPASACGVVGLKPTYGLVSNRGVIPVSDSLDHMGPLCKTVLDTAILLQAIGGYDPKWLASANRELPDYVAAIGEDFSPPRLGIPKAYFFDSLDPEVARLSDDAIETLRKKMAVVLRDDIIIPNYFALEQDLIFAEMRSYHAPLFEKAAGLYQPFLRNLLAGGWQGDVVSGVDYMKACQALQEARRQAAGIFDDNDVDLLVMPTWKQSPITIGERQKWLQSVENAGPYLLNTSPFNVLGLPAISIPCGYTKEGLPVGLQIVGRPFAEAEVLRFAHAYEQATQWHLRKPKL